MRLAGARIMHSQTQAPDRYLQLWHYSASTVPRLTRMHHLHSPYILPAPYFLLSPYSSTIYRPRHGGSTIPSTIGWCGRYLNDQRILEVLCTERGPDILQGGLPTQSLRRTLPFRSGRANPRATGPFSRYTCRRRWVRARAVRARSSSSRPPLFTIAVFPEAVHVVIGTAPVAATRGRKTRCGSRGRGSLRLPMVC